MKIRVLLLFLFVNTPALFSQVAGKHPFSEKKESKQIVSKPSGFDSTKTLLEQFKPENQYQFIGLQLFLPTVLNPDNGPLIFSKSATAQLRGNTCYTLVDILKGKAKEELLKKQAVNQCGYKFKNLHSPIWEDLIVHVVFELRPSSTNDTLNTAPLYWVVCQSKKAPYCSSNFNAFVAVPYLVKQKQLYQNQEVIDLGDKRIWLCTDVRLLKEKESGAEDSIFEVFYLFSNEKGEHMRRRPSSDKAGRTFITEKEYNRLDNANRNQKEELLKAETDKKEKYKSECVSRFGQDKGELIAQAKIEIGMTAEMCTAAWGSPWNKSGSPLSTEVGEIWFYNWNYQLHFENGNLVKIVH
jgi:hypothetical protein